MRARAFARVLAATVVATAATKVAATAVVVALAGCVSTRPGDRPAAGTTHADALAVLSQAGALPPSGRGLVALVFISPECPIANAMVPDLVVASREARQLGVAFAAVHPTPWADDAALRDHARDFEIEGAFPIVADRSLAVARMAGATVTPEAALLRLDDHGGVAVLYLGRVNDLYTAIGRRRAAATSNDLIEAMRAASRGSVVASPAPRAIGCFIAGASSEPTPRTPTGAPR